MSILTRAIIRLQGGIRAYAARRGMSTQEVEALKIQAAISGHQVRDSFTQKEAAAQRLQAGTKGYMLRKDVKKAINDGEIIQSAVYGRDVRVWTPSFILCITLKYDLDIVTSVLSVLHVFSRRDSV